MQQLTFDEPHAEPAPREPHAEPAPRAPHVGHTPQAQPPPRVEVVRSPKRRKTVSAREVDGVIRVSIPASMTRADEAKWVDEMVKRLTRRATAATVDLEERAADLAARFGLPRPASIRWVGNQASRWGSCTPADGTIRVSDRLAAFPPWVLDYVLVHELAHLAVAAHDDRFWALVRRYPRAERAIGYLMAKGMDEG